MSLLSDSLACSPISVCQRMQADDEHAWKAVLCSKWHVPQLRVPTYLRLLIHDHDLLRSTRVASLFTQKDRHATHLVCRSASQRNLVQKARRPATPETRKGGSISSVSDDTSGGDSD